jgi:hypothetical protein
LEREFFGEAPKIAREGACTPQTIARRKPHWLVT